MEDDWQQTAFSSRHMHNRNAGNNRGSGGTRSGRTKGAFDVRHMFGTYSFECPKAAGNSKTQSTSTKKGQKGGRKRDSGGNSTDAGVLEIYRMTNDGRGLIGSLLLPIDVGCTAWGAKTSGDEEYSSEVHEDNTHQTNKLLQATVILTGSRKVMRQLVGDLSREMETPDGSDKQLQTQPIGTDEGGKEEGVEYNGVDDSPEDVDRDSADDDQEEEPDDNSSGQGETGEEDRYQKPFEKNSFRSPKFWLEWREVTTEQKETLQTPLSGTAYLIFQGKDCRKFSGTMSCPSSDWDNLAVSGHKLASCAPRDTAASWPQ